MLIKKWKISLPSLSAAIAQQQQPQSSSFKFELPSNENLKHFYDDSVWFVKLSIGVGIVVWWRESNEMWFNENSGIFAIAIASK